MQGCNLSEICNVDDLDIEPAIGLADKIVQRFPTQYARWRLHASRASDTLSRSQARDHERRRTGEHVFPVVILATQSTPWEKQPQAADGKIASQKQGGRRVERVHSCMQCIPDETSRAIMLRFSL
jgi:hypothetical protein